MSYIGNTPFTAAFLTDTFSGNGSTVAFTMSVAPANTSSILVAITGVVQDPSTYSVSGTTLTFSAAPPSGTSNISVRYLGIPASGVTTTAYRTVTDSTATAGQTTFTIPSYTVGYVDVYRNGVRLAAADYTATTGTTVVLASAASAGDTITTESFYVSSVLNAIQQYNGTSVNQTLTTPTANTLTSGSGSNLQLQTNGGTTALTLDTAQNAGLGVTPSAWGGGQVGMQVKNASLSGYSNSAYVMANAYYDGTNEKYIASSYACKYAQASGAHIWYNAASGTAGNAISFTQAMTLNASGNLGVGTSSPSGRLHVEWSANNATAGMYLRNTSNGSSAYAGVYIGNDSSATDAFIGSLGSANTAYGGSRSFLIGSNSSTPFVFMTAGTERARIDSSGNLLVGTTTLTAIGASYNSFNVAGTDGSGIVLKNSAGTRFSYIWNDAANRLYCAQNSAGVYLANGGTSWTSASDERVKDIIEPITDAANKVSTLRAVIGKYKTDEEGTRRSFLIAQDVQAVLPEAVDASDPDELGVSYTEVIPLLVAAIKEQQAIIEQLQADVAALKGQA